MEEEFINRKVDRRRLLGRAGAVAATVAGAGAVSAAIASPASATTGDTMIVGQAMDAGSNATTLHNNSPNNPSLVLGNGSLVADGTAQKSGPALQLQPAGNYSGGPKGSLGMSTDGTLWTVPQSLIPDFVRTGANSTVLRSFSPVRILDTRPTESAGKVGIMNPSVIGPGGYVNAGAVLNVNLDSLLVWGWAIFANLTVIGGSRLGYITAFPAGQPQPLASNVNYSAGQTIANFAFISVGTITGAKNAISIFVGQPAVVIMDVSGAVVNYSSDVKVAAGPTRTAAAGTAPARVRPADLEPQLP